MKSIVITPENSKDLNFLKALLKKLGYSPRIIDDETKEDAALMQMMLEAKDDDEVPEDEIFKILEEK